MKNNNKNNDDISIIIAKLRKMILWYSLISVRTVQEK